MNTIKTATINKERFTLIQIVRGIRIYENAKFMAVGRRAKNVTNNITGAWLRSITKVKPEDLEKWFKGFDEGMQNRY